MATPAASHQSHQRWSLDNLSTELLILIFKQLGDADLRSLSAVRLVSTRFKTVATPMKYHTLHLTRYIVAPQAEIQCPEGVSNVCAHTRHVKVKSDLNAEHVKSFLDKMKRLSSVSWRYVRDDLHKGDFWVPTDILPPHYTQSSNFKLCIEDLPLRDFRAEKGNPYLKAIPTGVLVSLKTATPTPPLTARVESLKGLLVNSPRLETFWYDDRGQGTRFELRGNERLPPLRDLSLRSYDWNHGPNTVRRHWDFSEIRHLELVDVPLGPFLNSVLFTDFRHLKTLRLDDSSMHLPNRPRDTTRGQYALIKQIKALDDLQTICDIESFPIDGILQHAKNLQSLRFRDYTGFSDEDRHCPTLDLNNLITMSQTLNNLHTLEIDMDSKRCELQQDFLLALCNFRRLGTLTLHTQTVVNPFKHAKTSNDLDHEKAMQIFSFLHSKKSTPWRSITIIIGDWKPIMVRRLSARWRELGSRGVHAERCFVMEKKQDDSLAVYEKSPIRVS
ncbi:F-box domain-containing protein [Xylaria bambusicola]|uniref:F-box domain-containing protein n=1 Tax=Xylaria bambusicola TaxID=326684 RepID=UPI0020073582|nr:F-box domain-containing protein [Xylaria bambusicola]KAI0503017.1 F-box domain-containing protein [Xylaria bambusicola]